MNMVFSITKILFAYILWGAIFDQRDTVADFTFQTMLSYYVISSFLSQIEMSEGVSRELSTRIRGGTFSKYMVIPANVQGYFLAQTAGTTAFYLIFDLLATVIWVTLFHIQLAFTTMAMLISLALGMVLLGLVFMVQFNFFLGILTFKFQNIDLFLMIKGNLLAFFTGTMVPLALLPEPIFTAMRLFPFYYVTYLPSMLLIGRNGREAIPGLLILSAWNLVFLAANKMTYNRLRVRFDGVGI